MKTILNMADSVLATGKPSGITPIRIWLLYSILKDKKCPEKAISGVNHESDD